MKKTFACLLILLGASNHVSRADTHNSPKLEAVKNYVLKEDYPELFGDNPYRMKIDDAIVADIDNDGEEEVLLQVTPHFRQSPTIIIFKVSKNLKVTRVTEGLAPGPLVRVSGNYLDSHTLGEGVDLTLAKDQNNPEKRNEFVKAALKNMGGVVAYQNFFHMDGRKGKGTYVDMTHILMPADKINCEDFEFSSPDEIAVLPSKDGRGNYISARVGKSVYAYEIHKIRNDGLLEKTLTVIPLQ